MQKIIDGLNKYYHIIFFLFGFFLPLSTKLANVFFAISLCYILVISEKKEFSFYKRGFLFFSSLLLFIPCLVSLLTIDISSELINTFLKRSPYLISPIIFFFLKQERISIIKTHALTGIVWGSFLSAILLLINIVIQYFFFSSITNKIGGIFNYYHTNKTFFIIREFKKSNKIKNIAISVIGVSVLTCSFYFLKKTYVYHKLTKELKWELQANSSTKYNSKTYSDSRLSRWKVAVDLIMEKPILGYGINKEINTLKKGYKEAGLKYAYKEEYNSHNQFLGYFIEGGLLSFVGMLLFFGYSLFLGLIRKNNTTVFLIVLILFVCVAENYLIRNAGILFVAFFTSLFLIDNRQLTHISNK